MLSACWIIFMSSTNSSGIKQTISIGQHINLNCIYLQMTNGTNFDFMSIHSASLSLFLSVFVSFPISFKINKIKTRPKHTHTLVHTIKILSSSQNRKLNRIPSHQNWQITWTCVGSTILLWKQKKKNKRNGFSLFFVKYKWPLLQLILPLFILHTTNILVDECNLWSLSSLIVCMHATCMWNIATRQLDNAFYPNFSQCVPIH